MSKHGAASLFSVFRNRPFTLLWSGQLVSSMGSALTSLAASILVYQVTGSALSVGLMLMATAGPTILVGLFAGVIVDQYDRKRIMLASDLSRGLLIALIPLLSQIHIAWLYILVALTSAITQFFDSAHASILPEVASEEELSSANALMAVSSVGSTTVGFAAAGLLASGETIAWAFYLDAISFGVSALLILFTSLPRVPAAENTSLRAIGRNLQTGMRAVADIPILRSLFLVAIPIFLIFGLQNSILLPFMITALKGTEFQFGLQQAAEAAGIALGSLVMARLANRIREGQWLAISFLLLALDSILYSFSKSVGIAIFLVAVSGFVNAPSYIARQLVIQRAAPRALRGRINSAFFVVRDVMFVLGMAMAGLADLMDVRVLFLISALALLAAGAAVLFMPGLGEIASEWKRTWRLLRGGEAAPRLGAGRAATLDEIDAFVSHLPDLAGMSRKERLDLAAQTLTVRAEGGEVVVFRGENSDSAYYILKGSVGVGVLREDDYDVVNILQAGDFFGEVAALMGVPRSANVITEEESEFLILPAVVMRRLARQYPALGQVFQTTISTRLARIELPLGTQLDQSLLRELRTEDLPAGQDSPSP
jgi:CRP-like cAMP-binding protein/Na+/melibiose symporter-like transporter